MTPNQSINQLKSFDDDLQSAEKYCLQKGLRLTQKRKQLLSLLLTAEKALSAYELIELFTQRFNHKMPPMSAYRILDYLIGADLVHKIHTVNKFVACAHIGCFDRHEAVQLFFCKQCQRVQELPINPSIYKSFTDEIKITGNELCSQLIELNCICKMCSTLTNPS